MSKNNAHKQKHKTVFVILLILGILIFLFGITGLFAAPPFGIAFMVVGVERMNLTFSIVKTFQLMRLSAKEWKRA